MKKKEAEEKIEVAMAHVHAKRLGPHMPREKRLKFCLHDEEFEEIRATADSLGLSISDYFCTLHRYAVTRLEVSSKDDDWVHRSTREPKSND